MRYPGYAGGLVGYLATRFGPLWWFNRAAWTGGTPIEWVVIRALDVYGNVSQVVVAGAGGPYDRNDMGRARRAERLLDTFWNEVGMARFGFATHPTHRRNIGVIT